MLLIAFGLALVFNSARGLITLEIRSNTEHIAATLPTASENFPWSQIQGNKVSQRYSLTVTDTPITDSRGEMDESFSPFTQYDIRKPIVAAIPVGVLIPPTATALSPSDNNSPRLRLNSKGSAGNTQSQHIESVSKLARSQTTRGPNLQTPITKTALTYDDKISIPLPIIQNLPGVKSGSHFIEQSMGIFGDRNSFGAGSTSTLDSSTSNTLPIYPASGTHSTPVDASTALPSSSPAALSTSTIASSNPNTLPIHPSSSTHSIPVGTPTPSPVSIATASPRLPNTSPTLPFGKQTLTANSQGQYNVDGQTLVPGGAITVSGTAISLASDASDVVIGTSTEALGPRLTAGVSSGANGSNVQIFKGDAPGVRDGLWSSSVAMMVGVTVLLWL